MPAIAFLAIAAFSAVSLAGWNLVHGAGVMREARAQIRERVTAPGGSDADEAQQIYGSLEFDPVFVGPGGLTRKGRDVVAALEHADHDGLDPEAYGIRQIHEQIAIAGDRGRSANERGAAVAAADMEVTRGFSRLARDILLGANSPARAQPAWHIEDTDSISSVIDRVIAGEKADAVLASMRPEAAQYEALAGLLAKLREIAAAGGWPSVSDGKGSVDTGLLRARLMAGIDGREAELAARSTGQFGDRDAALDSAVVSFQHRHGLEGTGKLDRATIARLDVPVDARIRQVEIMLERWRWLPRALGERALVVNVPEFELRFYQASDEVLDMDVVVGRDDWKTDLFASVMDRIVLNPYWNVPESILEEDLISDLRDDPGVLARKGFEAVDEKGKVVDPQSVDWDAVVSGGDRPEFRLRQKPGAANALGFLKFVMPNPYGVYLHDSPAKSLFEKPFRALSHGCIRLAEPVRLAEFIVENTGSGDASDVRTAMDSRETREIKLAEPVNVYTVYFTVWVDSDGSARFLSDVYGFDRDFSGEPGRASSRVALGGRAASH